MSGFRVDNMGRVARGRPLSFTFNGQPCLGYEGDTVASALLADGRQLFGRSFKYHRPRGVLAAGSEEPNALVNVSRDADRSVPNVRATVQEVYEGLATYSQNHWPSLGVDVGAINDVLSPLFSAGFYYKTFMWPRQFWDKLYEPLIRGAAGLGRAPSAPDPDKYASRYAHCDVLIVGGGPAGLAAALAAGRSGAKTILCDEQAEFGGDLLSSPDDFIEGEAAWEWVGHAVAELASLSNVQVLPRTTAIGHYHQNYVGLCQRVTDHLSDLPAGAPRERLWRVRARQVVLAQGAIEKPLLFKGNDRPGVMLAGAGRTYLNRYGVAVGRQPVVCANHDSGWGVAQDFVVAGIVPQAIVDLREKVAPALREWAKGAGVPVYVDHQIIKTSGRAGVRRVDIRPNAGGAQRRIGCDAVLMAGGFTPSVHLHSHAKGQLEWRAETEMFVPGAGVEATLSAGAGNGSFTLVDALGEGDAAGVAAVNACGVSANVTARAVTERALVGGGVVRGVTPVKGRAFVDFQNDVTAKDISLAVREGFKSIEHIKRYTTTGMATDQGKTSNITGMRLAADAVGKAVPDVGLTTFRPPFTPTTFGALAGYARGPLFDPCRKTPIDPWADAAGAVFEPVGLWRRARHFPQAAEDMDSAVRRECAAVRAGVGIFDGSTLGKIEVSGPDAAQFLERLYTIPVEKLAVGRCRYGLMLGEDGYVRDDGIIARLAPDLFHVTTTSGGAAAVFARMQDYLQTEWPELQVWATSVTEQWAVITLSGPKARDVLKPLVTGLSIENENFAHMSVGAAEICGVPARVFRVSFTGELGYEINVPASQGLAVWTALHDAGKPIGLVPYGTEAVHVLRAEKGYIIVGQESDGTVTPSDLGMGWAVGKNKGDFIGKRSLLRADLVAGGRPQLVGLLTEDPALVLEEGAQLVADPDATIPMPMVGRVTSAYHSGALGRSIALALVAGGQSKIGEALYVPMPDRVHKVSIVAPVFVDPKGARLHV